MRKLGLIVIGLGVMLAGCKQTAPASAPQATQNTETQSDTTTSDTTSTEETQRSGTVPESKIIYWKSVNNADHQKENIAVARDTETGCEYIEFDDKTVTPRLDKDGKPRCGS